MNKTKTLQIVAGDIPLAITLDDHQILKQLQSLYAPFAGGGDAACKIKIKVTKGTSNVSVQDQVDIKFSNHVYQVINSEYSARIDLKKKIGTIDISSDWKLEACSNAIKNVYTFLIINTGGLVLHASGVARQEQAYIFCGSSGAGKTTVAEISQENVVLGEELIGIKADAQSWRAFSIPYQQDCRFPRRSNDFFRIAGLFQLVQDTSNHIIPIPKPRALADFFILPVGFEKFTSCYNLLEKWHRLVNEVGCFELHFLPNSSFWHCITKSGGRSPRGHPVTLQPI